MFFWSNIFTSIYSQSGKETVMKKINTVYDEHSSLSKIKYQLDLVYAELKINDANFEFTDHSAFVEHVENANDPCAELDRWHSLSKRR